MAKCSLLKGHGLAGKCDLCKRILPKRRRRWCSDKCGLEFSNNHNYSSARKLAKRRDKYRCVKCGSKTELEINHIKPCLGKHSVYGCWHHLENLETLCHQCHVKETNIQRENGEFDKKKRRRRKKR